MTMLNAQQISLILTPYNPWWNGQESAAFERLPDFRRPVFFTLMEDLEKIPQMLSVIGPRRIGKSTLLKQMIRRLLETGTAPERILYFSFDDPAVGARQGLVDDLIRHIMAEASKRKRLGPTFLFLDEIQRLERWELYLKKYYDLKYPVRIVISGSASSPIFKKSRESLLGRVKDYHLLPFSFREYSLYTLRRESEFTQEMDALHGRGKEIQGILAEDPTTEVQKVGLSPPSPALRERTNALLNQFFLEGGFPEVWELPTWVAKQEYLYDNQVKKVIYEDLVLAAEFRKPELLKRFYLSLLEMPGREVNIQAVARETGVKAAQIDKYLPLLEMTDLLYHISKFRSGPVRIRKGMMKFYLVDLALRNAALRLTDSLLGDEAALGLYAENLVYLSLRKWSGTIQMDYYRERQSEVDFIVHTSPHRFLPVEVKYQNDVAGGALQGIHKFLERYPKKSLRPILVTKRWTDFGHRDVAFFIPLPMFLILFD